MTSYADIRRDRITEAKAIAEKAVSEKRQLTAEENTRIKECMAEVEKANVILAQVAEDKALLDSIAASGRELYPNELGGGLDPWGVHGRGYLRLKSAASATAHRLAQQVRPDHVGRKALVGQGSVTTGVVMSPEVLAEGKAATSIFDVLHTVKRSSPVYRYLRQTARDNNAAVVAPGETKPTSVYSIESVDGELVVVAHLSEPVDSYMVTGTPGLQSFISTELAYGLSAAVEAKVLDDIAATSGIQALLPVPTCSPPPGTPSPCWKRPDSTVGSSRSHLPTGKPSNSRRTRSGATT